MDELLNNKDKIFSVIDFFSFNLFASDIKYPMKKIFTFDEYKKAIINFKDNKNKENAIDEITKNTDKLYQKDVKIFLNFNCIYYYGSRGCGKTMFTKNSANHKDIEAYYLKDLSYEKIKDLEENINTNNLKYVIFDGINEFDFSLKRIFEKIIINLLAISIKVIITGVCEKEIKKLDLNIGTIEFKNSLESNYMYRVSTLISPSNYEKYYKIIQTISFNLLSLREINYFIHSLIILSNKGFVIKKNTDHFIFIWRNILEHFFEFYFEGEKCVDWKSYWTFLKNNIKTFYYGIDEKSEFFKKNKSEIIFFNSRSIVAKEKEKFVLKDRMLYLPLLLTHMRKCKDDKEYRDDVELKEWYTAFVLLLKSEKMEEVNIEFIINKDDDILLVKRINKSILNKLMLLFSFKEKRKKLVLNKNHEYKISFFYFLISNFNVQDLNECIELEREDYEKCIKFLIDNINIMKFENILCNFIDLTDFNDRNMEIFYISYFTNRILNLSENDAIIFYKRLFNSFSCYKTFVKWANIFLRIKIFQKANSHVNILKYHLKKTFYKYKKTLTYKYVFYNYYFLHLDLINTPVNNNFGNIHDKKYLININNSLIQNAYIFLCYFFKQTEYHTCEEIKEIMNLINDKFSFPRNVQINSYFKLHYTTSTKIYNSFDWKVIELIDFIILKYFKKKKCDAKKNRIYYSDIYLENNLKIEWPLINNNFFICSNLIFCDNKIPDEKMWNIKYYPLDKEKFRKITNNFIKFLLENKFYAFNNKVSLETGFKIYYIFKEIKFEKEFYHQKIYDIVTNNCYIDTFEVSEFSKEQFIFQIQLYSETIFSSKLLNHKDICINDNGELKIFFPSNPSTKKRINWSTKVGTVFFDDDSQTWFKIPNNDRKKNFFKYYVCYCESWNTGNIIRRWIILKYNKKEVFFQEVFDTSELGMEVFKLKENKWVSLK